MKRADSKRLNHSQYWLRASDVYVMAIWVASVSRTKNDRRKVRISFKVLRILSYKIPREGKEYVGEDARERKLLIST